MIAWAESVISQQDIIGAVALGFLSVKIASTISRLVHSRAARRKTEEADFDTAITSDNLEHLGRYLGTRLGTVSVATYLRDPVAHQRIDRYVGKLTELVRLPKEDTKQVSPDAQEILVEPSIMHFETMPQDPPVLAAALNNLRQGETWTALARLRRDLEIRLKSSSLGSDATRGPVYRNIEDRDLSAATRQFWHIASRAIHGDEITTEEAARAIKIAREIYRRLGIVEATLE